MPSTHLLGFSLFGILIEIGIEIDFLRCKQVAPIFHGPLTLLFDPNFDFDFDFDFDYSQQPTWQNFQKDIQRTDAVKCVSKSFEIGTFSKTSVNSAGVKGFER